MNCRFPQGKRVNLELFCEKDELDSLKLILNKVSTASQAAHPESLPDNMVDYELKEEPQKQISKRKAEIFFKAALTMKAEAQFLERDWWEGIIRKYKLPVEVPVMVDMGTGQFYRVIENKKENG